MIVKASRIKLGPTTNLLITGTCMLALSHSPPHSRFTPEGIVCVFAKITWGREQRIEWMETMFYNVPLACLAISLVSASLGVVVSAHYF